MRTAVLIPCYNEAETVAKVVADFKNLPDTAVYVYDNNCTDDTADLACRAGAVVKTERRQGKGWVVRSMFRDIEADCYLMVDGDDTYDAREALSMCELVRNGSADMVVGDRLSSTYFAENTRPLHGIGNRLVRLLVNSLFASNINDIMSGCRCFSRSFVKSLPITSGGFEIETAMTIHALDKDFLIAEMPITYRERKGASVSKLRTVPDGFAVLRTILLLFRDYRPLYFFGLVAVVLFAGSALMFLPPLREYLLTGFVKKVPSLVVSIGLGTSALLAFMCGVILESIRRQARQSYELTLNMITLAHKSSVVTHGLPEAD